MACSKIVSTVLVTRDMTILKYNMSLGVTLKIKLNLRGNFSRGRGMPLIEEISALARAN